MKYRKLRIAWSVAWGLLAVLLCVLWVRSYWWADFICFDRSGDFEPVVRSEVGTISIFPPGVTSWTLRHVEFYFPNAGLEIKAVLLGRFELDSTELTFPHWFAVAVSGLMVVAPWLPLRFSLRTLLIATTLVAVGLGLVVWASRTQ